MSSCSDGRLTVQFKTLFLYETEILYYISLNFYTAVHFRSATEWMKRKEGKTSKLLNLHDDKMNFATEVSVSNHFFDPSQGFR